MSEHKSMRGPFSQWLVPAALLMPLALVGLLLVHGRQAELAQQQIVERAMRDYSNIAAWQFVQHSQETIHHQVTFATNGGSCAVDAAVPIAVSQRTHFHFNARTGQLVFEGVSPTERDRRDVARLIRVTRPSKMPEPHRLVFDSVGGRMRAIALNVGRNPSGGIDSIHGVLLDTTEIKAALDSMIASRSLIPNAVLRSPLRREQVRVRLTAADGRQLFTVGSAPGSTVFATDTIAAQWGGARATVELDPAIGTELLLVRRGQYPLPMLVALASLAGVLALLALAQLRRSRELARLRTQFVANVSHELRTPLTHISMFAETLMMERERSSIERHRFASVIFREARRLTNLVDGVMRFSRIDAGRERLHLTTLDVGNEVREALDTFQPMLDAADCQVEAVLPQHVFVEADAGALRQIVTNLLDNAVKYGPRGQTVSVSLSVASDAATLVVADDGPGIPADQRRRVFEPFTRLADAGRPRVAGAGIGLAVVFELVTKLGGAIGIADQPGGGARVWVQLPLASAPHVAAPVRERAVVERGVLVAR